MEIPLHKSRLVSSLAIRGLYPLCCNNGETFGVRNLELEFGFLLVLVGLIVLTHHQPSGGPNCKSGEISVDCNYGWVIGGALGYD